MGPGSGRKAAAAALVAALLLAAVVVGLSRIAAPAATYQPGVVIECVTDAAEGARLKEILTRGLDSALSKKSELLYSNWISEYARTDSVRRAQNGLSNAIAGWLDAERGVNAYVPVICK